MLVLSSDDFFSRLIDDSVFPSDVDAVAMKRFPGRKEVFGGIVSHLVVL